MENGSFLAFAAADDFHEGMAAVTGLNVWGYTDNRIAIGCAHLMANAFSEDLGGGTD